MDMGLRDKLVLVTGASSGIGRATALAYAAEGARVAVTYSSGADRAAELVAEIEVLGGQAQSLHVDLAQPDTIDAAFAAIGPVDVLVANAVALPAWRSFAETPLAEWLADVAINLEGTIRTVAATLPGMRAQGAGRIVVISSGSGTEGLPNGTAYLTAKMALEGFARSLAWEEGPNNILVNAVAPGVTLTRPATDVAGQARRDALAARIPSQRLSLPDDVARLILYLGSFANTNMTGEVLREGSSNGRSSHIG